MNPGHTTRPLTSRVVAPAPASASPSAPRETIRPSRTPTSLTSGTPPVPSTTVPPRRTRSSTSGPAEQPVDGRLDHGPLEEAGIGAGVEPGRVDEGELLEGTPVDPPVVDHLPGLGQHVTHVGDVPVGDVRPHHHLHLGAERVDRGVE